MDYTFLYIYLDQYKEKIKKDFTNHALEEIVWHAYRRADGGNDTSTFDLEKSRSLTPGQMKLVTISYESFIYAAIKNYVSFLWTPLIRDLFHNIQNKFSSINLSKEVFRIIMTDWIKKNLDLKNLGAMMEGAYNYAVQKGQERNIFDNSPTDSSEVFKILEQYKKEFRISKWKIKESSERYFHSGYDEEHSEERAKEYGESAAIHNVSIEDYIENAVVNEHPYSGDLVRNLYQAANWLEIQESFNEHATEWLYDSFIDEETNWIWEEGFEEDFWDGFYKETNHYLDNLKNQIIREINDELPYNLKEDYYVQLLYEVAYSYKDDNDIRNLIQKINKGQEMPESLFYDGDEWQQIITYISEIDENIGFPDYLTYLKNQAIKFANNIINFMEFYPIPSLDQDRKIHPEQLDFTDELDQRAAPLKIQSKWKKVSDNEENEEIRSWDEVFWDIQNNFYVNGRDYVDSFLERYDWNEEPFEWVKTPDLYKNEEKFVEFVQDITDPYYGIERAADQWAEQHYDDFYEVVRDDIEYNFSKFDNVSQEEFDQYSDEIYEFLYELSSEVSHDWLGDMESRVREEFRSALENSEEEWFEEFRKEKIKDDRKLHPEQEMLDVFDVKGELPYIPPDEPSPWTVDLMRTQSKWKIISNKKVFDPTIEDLDNLVYDEIVNNYKLWIEFAKTIGEESGKAFAEDLNGQNIIKSEQNRVLTPNQKSFFFRENVDKYQSIHDKNKIIKNIRPYVFAKIADKFIFDRSFGFSALDLNQEIDRIFYSDNDFKKEVLEPLMDALSEHYWKGFEDGYYNQLTAIDKLIDHFNKKSAFEDWSTPETSILIDEILYDSRILKSPMRTMEKIVRKGGTAQDLANWLIDNILTPYNEMVMRNWEEISDEQDVEAQKQELRRTWKQQARKQFPFSMQKQKQYVQEMEQMQFGLLGDPEPENIERYLLKVENIDWQEIYDWVKEDLQYRGKISSYQPYDDIYKKLFHKGVAQASAAIKNLIQGQTGREPYEFIDYSNPIIKTNLPEPDRFYDENQLSLFREMYEINDEIKKLAQKISETEFLFINSKEKRDEVINNGIQYFLNGYRAGITGKYKHGLDFARKLRKDPEIWKDSKWKIISSNQEENFVEENFEEIIANTLKILKKYAREEAVTDFRQEVKFSERDFGGYEPYDQKKDLGLYKNIEDIYVNRKIHENQLPLSVENIKNNSDLFLTNFEENFDWILRSAINVESKKRDLYITDIVMERLSPVQLKEMKEIYIKEYKKEWQIQFKLFHNLYFRKQKRYSSDELLPLQEGELDFILDGDSPQKKFDQEEFGKNVDWMIINQDLEFRVFRDAFARVHAEKGIIDIDKFKWNTQKSVIPKNLNQYQLSLMNEMIKKPELKNYQIINYAKEMLKNKTYIQSFDDLTDEQWDQMVKTINNAWTAGWNFGLHSDYVEFNKEYGSRGIDFIEEEINKYSSHGQNQMAIGDEVAETTFEGVEVDPDPEPEEKIINGKKWKMVRPKPNKQPAEYARPKGGWGFYSKHKKSDLNDWTDSTKLAIEKIIKDLPNKLKIRAAADADGTVRDWIQNVFKKSFLVNRLYPDSYYDFNTQTWRNADGLQIEWTAYEGKMIPYHNTETSRLINKDQISLGLEQVRNMADVALWRYDRFDQNLYWELGRLVLDSFPGITWAERKDIEIDIYNIINKRELESIYNDAYYEAWEKAFNEEVSQEESLINKNSKKDAWEAVLDGELGHDIITTGTWEEVKKQTIKWLKQLKDGYINKKNPHDNKKIDAEAKEQDGHALEDLKLYEEEKRWSFHFDHGKHPYDLIIQPVGYKESKWKISIKNENNFDETIKYQIKKIKRYLPSFLFGMGEDEGITQRIKIQESLENDSKFDEYYVNNNRFYNPEQLTIYHSKINETEKERRFSDSLHYYILDHLDEIESKYPTDSWGEIVDDIFEIFDADMKQWWKEYDQGFNLGFTQGPRNFYINQ